jgi:hypothetical protein
MVRAILEGRKTQTRRLLKPWAGYQAEWLTMDTLHKAPTCYLIQANGHLGAQMQHPEAGRTVDGVKVDAMSPLTWVRLPYQAGDTLWVREGWRTLHKWNDLAPRHLPDDQDKIDYLADGGVRNPLWAWGKGRPSIHMPRWASRISLKVTDVKVERLQHISEADAEAEGAEPILVPPDGGGAPHVEGFQALWTSINGAESWQSNPWVAVYTFERIKS